MQITLLWDILIFRFPLISSWWAVTRWLAVAWPTYDQSSSFSGSWFQVSIFHHQASAKSSADNPNTHCLMLNIQNIQNISDLWLTGGHMMEEPDGEGENICLPCIHDPVMTVRCDTARSSPAPARQVTAVYEGSLRGGAHTNNYIINFPDWI